ncbi:MAG: hypothetical protein QM607_09200 [Microbacterium sp.]
MNTTHAPRSTDALHTELPQHPPSLAPSLTPSLTATLTAELATRTPRTALGDRIALRIGLWLLLWGSRPAAHRRRLSDEQARLHAAITTRREELRADAARYKTPIGILR